MNKYVFRSYSSRFPILFKNEKERIEKHLHKKAVIEHVGSSAIAALGGKGIIDIAMCVDKSLLKEMAIDIEKLGYEFRKNGSTPDRLYFRIDLPDQEEEIKRYHLHLTHPQINEWKELLAFRGYLRTRLKVMQEYAAIKLHAVESVEGDGERYRNLKDSFLKNFFIKSAKASVKK